MTQNKIVDKQERRLNIAFAFILILATIVCVAPYLLVLAGSMTDEAELRRTGLSLIPTVFSGAAYKLLFSDFERVLNSYKVTIIVAAAGTMFSLLINAMIAYALSRRACKYRNALSFFCYFTMLFNGGMVPWYIVCSQYLGLHNNILALILPYSANAWYMFMMRNYFKALPEEMFESAEIDGAGEYRMFFTIAVPLSVPVFASVGMFMALAYWNDWWLGLMLTEKANLRPLQLLLRSIISTTEFLNSEKATNIIGQARPPSEGIKYAATIITIGPILFLYPFIQKYFVKGLTIGAVKG